MKNVNEEMFRLLVSNLEYNFKNRNFIESNKALEKISKLVIEEYNKDIKL